MRASRISSVNPPKRRWPRPHRPLPRLPVIPHDERLMPLVAARRKRVMPRLEFVVGLLHIGMHLVEVGLRVLHDTVSDFSYTNKTVIRVTREVLCHAKHKKKHARPQRKRGMNRWLHHRRQEQKLVYFELFKVSSARDKTRYIEESKQKAAQKTA